MEATRNQVSRRTLETMPERAVRFLRTIVAEPAIQRALEKHGYSAAEHQEGWRRVHEACGYRAELPPEDTSDAEVRAAVAELDAVDDPIFRVAKATLENRFPRQAQFLFAGIGVARGRASVLSLEILLDRLEVLELGIDREDTRDEDRAAVALTEERILSQPERARLRALIEIAKRSKPVTDTVDRKAVQREQTKRLMQLRAWYVEWTEIAKAVIPRGDYLIRLGLATQKVKRRAGRPRLSTAEQG